MGCPSAAAAAIIAAYCSGVGLWEGIGSLLGLFVGGGVGSVKNDLIMWNDKCAHEGKF